MTSLVSAIRRDAVLAAQERSAIQARRRLHEYPEELLSAALEDVTHELADLRYEVARHQAIDAVLAAAQRMRAAQSSPSSPA